MKQNHHRAHSLCALLINKLEISQNIKHLCNIRALQTLSAVVQASGPRPASAADRARFHSQTHGFKMHQRSGVHSLVEGLKLKTGDLNKSVISSVCHCCWCSQTTWPRTTDKSQKQ